jgi:CheY-like chemotaxis protein
MKILNVEDNQASLKLVTHMREVLNSSAALQGFTGERQAQSAAPGTEDRAPVQILVVEDDPASLRLAGAVLMASGYLVSVATSAAQAIASVRANPPALILLDLNLPGTDGLEAARELKQNPVTRHIPILAVTAYSDMFSRETALSAKCNAYLVKPLDTRRLPEQLARLLDGAVN